MSLQMTLRLYRAVLSYVLLDLIVVYVATVGDKSRGFE